MAAVGGQKHILNIMLISFVQTGHSLFDNNFYHQLFYPCLTLVGAIVSDFHDFEDAIQYSCALENNLTTIITRNVKDYKKASIPVLTPETFIALPS